MKRDSFRQMRLVLLNYPEPHIRPGVTEAGQPCVDPVVVLENSALYMLLKADNNVQSLKIDVVLGFTSRPCVRSH